MRRISAILALAAVLAAPVLAHDIDRGPNGGRVVDAGDYHVELVARDGGIEVFVTDSDEKPAGGSFKGLAILVVDGKQQRIALESAAPGRLTGKAAGKLAQARGVVQLTTPQGATVQARFK